VGPLITAKKGEKKFHLCEIEGGTARNDRQGGGFVDGGEKEMSTIRKGGANGGTKVFLFPWPAFLGGGEVHANLWGNLEKLSDRLEGGNDDWVKDQPDKGKGELTERNAPLV